MKWKLTTTEERQREMSLAAKEARGEAEELLSQCSATDSHDQSSMVSVCITKIVREREREREQCTGVCALCTTALVVCISLQCGLGGPMVLDKTSGTYLNLEHGLCYHVKAQPKPYTLINNNHNNKKKLEAEAFKLCLNTTSCIFTHFFSYKYFHKI